MVCIPHKTAEIKITTDKADRCVRKVKVSEKRIARVCSNDSVWKPNVATFRYKRKLHVALQMVCMGPTSLRCANVFLLIYFVSLCSCRASYAFC